MSEELQGTLDVDAGKEAGTEKTPTVGQTLRAAREAARMTVVDVAQSLKFSPRQVEQLEADDYDALPGNTIVRGFARSYARLLKLDADALLNMLDARTPNAPADVRPPDNMGVASQPGGLRQISPLASAAIVLALAAVLLALWHFIGPKAKPPTAGVNGDKPTDTQAQTIPVPIDAAPTVVPAPSLPVAPAPAGGAATESAPAAPAPATPLPAAPTVPPSSAAPAQPAVATGPMLVFLLDDRSWVEVSDATKKVLHTGESPAGTRLALAGQPPFDIVVGNAGKVKLSYGEREVDLAPYTRAEVARLKLEK